MRSAEGLQEGHLIATAITPRIWDKKIASLGCYHHLPTLLPPLPEAAVCSVHQWARIAVQSGHKAQNKDSHRDISGPGFREAFV